MADEFKEKVRESNELAEKILHPKLEKNVVSMKFKDVNPAPYNPRIPLKPGDEVYEQLKRSITHWGVVQHPVFNKQTGHLVAGHQRLTVLQDLGYTETDFVIVDISLEEEKALNLALNKITGFWDLPKLQTVLDELHTFSEDLTHLTGFSDDELHKLLDEGDASDLEDFEKFDEQIDTEYKCPKCGYVWSGNPK
jgi:ParB-like chromosome segregation protein Spo0J